MLAYFWALPPDLDKILYDFLRSKKIHHRAILGSKNLESV